MSKRGNPRLKTAGFTIIELMIATAIFSTILLMVTYGLTQIGRMYSKAVNLSSIQSASRSINDTISQAIQFGGHTPLIGSTAVNYGVSPNTITVKSFCIGDKRYSYAIDAEVDDSVPSGTFDTANRRIRHALWVDDTTVPNCPPLDLTQANPSPTDGTSTNGKELLGARQRLGVFDITPIDTGKGLWNVHTNIILGDTDLLDSSHQHCLGGVSGDQFCATSELSTAVFVRVKGI